jgi:hypothetical protein
MKRLLLAIAFFAIACAPATAVPIQQDGKELSVPVCGGFAGVQCESNEWCDFPDDGVCGVGDRFGTCRPRPGTCTMENIPVCGCNAKTYSNACMAAMDGVDIAHLGECGSTK